MSVSMWFDSIEMTQTIHWKYDEVTNRVTIYHIFTSPNGEKSYVLLFSANILEEWDVQLEYVWQYSNRYMGVCHWISINDTYHLRDLMDVRRFLSNNYNMRNYLVYKPDPRAVWLYISTNPVSKYIYNFIWERPECL